ncbi:tumor necrosis factor-like [Myxocyprinus asiaticus]|uniref:tumor necrosis factor-like n=1 Tax=Myxocyprinus asiaticus TaxID=70543 RepID=UPI002221A023|nr:tumor necrosis factor-like [Myxocyprinus asiaticus]
MGHENQILLDLEDGVLPVPQVMVSRWKAGSLKSRILRVCGALLAVALCAAAAAVCFTFNKSQNNQDGGNYLRHALRSYHNQANITAKTAIHLIGTYNGVVPKLEWKVNQDQAFSAGGLKLVDNEIIIPHDGIYFVYSQAFFNVRCTPDPDYPEEHEIVHLSHTVSRYSDSYGNYKPLFNAVRSVCVQMPDSDELWYNTIYLGAAFRLERHNRLCSNMSENLLRHIETDHGKTYFGAFAL